MVPPHLGEGSRLPYTHPPHADARRLVQHRRRVRAHPVPAAFQNPAATSTQFGQVTTGALNQMRFFSFGLRTTF